MVVSVISLNPLIWYLSELIGQVDNQRNESSYLVKKINEKENKLTSSIQFIKLCYQLVWNIHY